MLRRTPGSTRTDTLCPYTTLFLAWNFHPAVTLPLFNAGRLKANLRTSEAQRDEAVATYEKAIQSAFREAADALARRSTIKEQLDAQESLGRASADSYRLAEARYRTGDRKSTRLNSSH